MADLSDWTPFTRAEIIKPARDRDFYVAWSHIVEAPTWAGTYAEAFMAGCDLDRLDRADANGSSMHLHDPWSTAPPPGCWWAADGLIAEQLGYLPRAKLAAYVTAYCQKRLGKAYGMLTRFEDVSREAHLAKIKRALRRRDKWRMPRSRTRTHNRKPLAVNGHEYHRRQQARQRRTR